MTDIVEELRNDRENGAKRLVSEYKAGLLTLARRLYDDPSDAEAIREIDPNATIIVECNVNCAPDGYRNMSPLDLPDIIYEVHMYAPGDFTHQGIQGMSMAPCRWPDESRGWNRECLRSVLAPVRQFQLRHGARIYVGEFSAVAWAEGADVWLRDAISLFAEYGWDWTYHAFREWRGWSVEHEGPDIDHLVPANDNPRKSALLEGFRGGNTK